MATFGPAFAESFRAFGELVTELLKLAALLLFGAVIAPKFFSALPGAQYVFIVLAVFAVRPAALWLSLLRPELRLHERLLAGWFGPKGFASVVNGLLIFQAGLLHVAHLVGLAVAASIVVYSFTDVLVGRWFQQRYAGLRIPESAPDRGPAGHP